MSDLNEQINSIIQDPDKCATFAEAFVNEIESDDESSHKAGFNALLAYLNGDVDSFSIALCGWSVRSILARAGLIPDEEGVAE